MLVIASIVVVLAIAVAGCTGSAPEGGTGLSKQDAYLNAYCTGMDYHSRAQDYFSNGTIAWESGDFRKAVAEYANASMDYDAAANVYGEMARYAASPGDGAFGDSLRGCAFNLSRASDSFMNAAIALEENDTDKAYGLFEEGQSYVNDSDMMLDRCIALTPEWLLNLTSG
ncbi:MAG: hypothetical protein A4E28_02017 [Methanocella sp. PtaU1.Bin125]|nr:MAG: hypothetical protein A4E28_02017 [Methanocella sp. PtaU1.Bin125]